MRPLPREVIDIGWNELSPGFGGESRELELIRQIYQEDDLEGRETALDTGCQWFGSSAAPAAQWIQSLIPLLSDESDPLVPSVLMYLSFYADTSLPGKEVSAEQVEATMAAIRAGHERYLKLFHIAPLCVKDLLTASPDRAPDYLPLLRSLYHSESDLSIRAGIVLTLAKVADYISDWRNQLLEGIREGANSALAFVCAVEIAALDGEAASPEIFDAVVRSSNGDASAVFFRRCMVRLLPKISRRRQVITLTGILGEAKDTATSLSITKFLLEAAYGELGVVSDLPDLISDAGSASVGTHYFWVGPPRTRDMQLPAGVGREDWLGAIVQTEGLRREINPYHPPSDVGPTNLYQLFGLPRDHSGLASLWTRLKDSK